MDQLARFCRKLKKGDKTLMSVVFWGVTFFTYAEAYLDATKCLAQMETRKYHEGDWNIFGMPILFLFRHYLELGMKACILMKKEMQILGAISQPDTSREEALKAVGIMDERLKCTHDLSKLVKDLKDCFHNEKGLFSKDVQNHLDRLSDYDKKSEVFRYPLDNKGAPLLPDNPIMRMDEIRKMIEETSIELNSIAEQLIEDLHSLQPI